MYSAACSIDVVCSPTNRDLRDEKRGHFVNIPFAGRLSDIT
jgi:hypothetical protein